MQLIQPQVAPSGAVLPRGIGRYKLIDAWNFGKTIRGTYRHVTKKPWPGRTAVVEIQSDGSMATIWGRNLFAGMDRPMAPNLLAEVKKDVA